MSPSTLQGSSEPLDRVYDVALLDLDGVVYIGPDAVPGVPDALRQVRDAGMRLAFVTNNAARPPEAVVEHLDRLGVTAEVGEVVTSAQAAAHYLSDRLPAGARVLVIGTTGLEAALRERGLTPVGSADDDPAAVAQGFSPQMDWKLLCEGAIAIRAGLPWVATNLDATVPSPRGPVPGNGSLVATLRHATGREPEIATGKPDPTMHRESVQRSGAQRPLVVGDRLDTDIEGATAAGCPSLLVLSGVTDAAGLLAAPANRRPDYLGRDVSALLFAHPAPVAHDGGLRCGPWQVSRDGSACVLTRTADGDGTADGLDALRALAPVAWAIVDDGHAVSIRGGDDEGRAECARWDLA